MKLRKKIKRLARPFKRAWRLQTMTSRVIILDEAGRVLLLRRSATDPRRPGTWDMPGGTVEFGEDPAVSAAREVREEAGLEIPAGLLNPHRIISSYRRDDKKNSWNDLRKWYGTIIIYRNAVPVVHGAGPWNGGGDGPVRISSEHDDFAWVDPSDLDVYDAYPMADKYREILVTLPSAATV